MDKKAEVEVRLTSGKIFEYFSWGILLAMVIFLVLVSLSGKNGIAELKTAKHFAHFPYQVLLGFALASVRKCGYLLSLKKADEKIVTLIFSRFAGMVSCALLAMLSLMLFQYSIYQIGLVTTSALLAMAVGWIIYDLMSREKLSLLVSAIVFAIIFYLAGSAYYALTPLPSITAERYANNFYLGLFDTVICGIFFCTLEYREKFPIGKMLAALSALLAVEFFMLSTHSSQEVAVKDFFLTGTGMLMGYVPAKLFLSLRARKESEDKKDS